MTKELNLLINDKKFVLSSLFLKACLNLDLSLTEFYLLIYFENDSTKTLDPKKISDDIGIDEKDVLEAFNSLLNKKVITITTSNDLDGRMLEKVSLEGVYGIVGDIASSKVKATQTSTIYETFEKEFGRTISPMEYEIINAWLDNNTSEEIILGALKEAVYNGAKSFRYIDKIIYDWNQKGFKNVNDVKKHMTSKKNNQEVELFDYDWLGDDNND